MNKIKKMALLPALVLFSIGAQAELVSTDWNNSGDSLATLDTQSGLEWMDFTETKGLSITDVSALLDTTYDGWRIPSFSEISTLFTNINGNITTSEDSGNYYGGLLMTETANLVHNLFGKTGYNKGRYDEQHFSQALHVSADGESAMLGTFVNFTSEGSDNFIYYNHPTSNIDYRDPGYGVFLVSDGGTTLSSINNPDLNANNINAPVNQVPLPATLGLLGVAMAGLSFRRKSKK
jgi:hypothetical protein